jgi:hypothetical protein
VSRKPADRVESVLRQADATFESWFRRAKKRGAGLLRHRVDDLQAGLKKLSTGLEHAERDREAAAVSRKAEPIKREATPAKRRTGPATARKSSVRRKPKKAA